MAEILDLDALVPQTNQVKFGKKLYPVHPPTTESVFILTKLGGRLEQAGIKNQPKVALQVFEAVRAEVSKCIPDLDAKELTAGQLFGLSQFVIGLGIPKMNGRFNADMTTENVKKKRKPRRG